MVKIGKKTEFQKNLGACSNGKGMLASHRFVHILPHNGYYALAFVSPKMI